MNGLENTIWICPHGHELESICQPALCYECRALVEFKPKVQHGVDGMNLEKCDACGNSYEPCCGHIEDGGFICQWCLNAEDPERSAVWNEQYE